MKDIIIVKLVNYIVIVIAVLTDGLIGSALLCCSVHCWVEVQTMNMDFNNFLDL